MSTPTNIVVVPRAKRTSFNKFRSLKSNALLEWQLKHFQAVEKTLPPELQTGTPHEQITNQHEAGIYIAKLTAVLTRKRKQAP